MPIIGMLGSWMLPIPGASSGMLNHQGFLFSGYLAHLRDAPLHTIAPGGSCMLSTHGGQFIAKHVLATSVQHDGCVHVTYLGTHAPYTGQKGSHVDLSENLEQLSMLCHHLSGALRP